MSRRNLPLRCWRCNAFGHRAAECPDNWADDDESVDESVRREPPRYGGQQRAALYNEQLGQQAGGFGGRMNAPPAFFNQQQQQQPPPPPPPQPPQGHMMPQNFGGIPVAPVGQRHFGMAENVTPQNVGPSLESFMRQTGVEDAGALFMSRQSLQEMRQYFSAVSTQRLRARINRNQDIDTMSLPVMARGDAPRPAQPQQPQAGRGGLAGARNAQPNRGGAGLLGNYRVQRPAAARGQGQQHGQRNERGGRGGRPAEREDDEPRGRAGGRSVHTDHPPSFACTICGGTDHTEADCAKPSRLGDSSYCPYHRTVSGSEEHADSVCHKSVDKCWEAAVDKDGRGLARAEIDRVVTGFVQAHRGGRPEPRCANIHSHWAMCVSRHISANGLGGIDASLLPVRRSEVLRRGTARELSWRQFNHSNVAESRRQFRDTHWEGLDQRQLIERLENHARTETYQPGSQRRQRRPAQDEAPAEGQDEGMAAEEEQSGAGAGADNASADESNAQGDAAMSDAATLLEENEVEDFELELDLDPGQDYAAETESRVSDEDDEMRSDGGPDPREASHWARPQPQQPYAEGGDDEVDFDLE